MAHPKYKTSKSKRNMRRSHHALKPNGVSVCSNCNEIVQPHHACKACGHYAGRQVLEAKSANLGFENASEFEG
jgi:large subunit ribosomal protein L32